MTRGEDGSTPTDVPVRVGLEYADHDGVSLVGDLYTPATVDRPPVVVAVHGGGWQSGDRSFYRHWGPYFASHGIGLFSIDYRLAAPGRPSFPEAAHDVRAAIQFVRGNAVQLGVDPNRIALMGDSAGAHLTSLVALTDHEPLFQDGYPGDLHAIEPSTVRAVIALYGVYDLVQQWRHDRLARPHDPIVENFLGASPIDDRRIYFDASPLSYATSRKNAPAFLISWGRLDDIVDHQPQSISFRDTLKQACYPVESVEIPTAGHFWSTDPLDEPCSHSGYLAPRALRFLQRTL
jgi:acetyl esterase/lipase